MKITITDLTTGGTVLLVEERNANALFDALSEDLQLRVTEFLKRAMGNGVGTESPANAMANMTYTSMLVVADKVADELAPMLADKFHGQLFKTGNGRPDNTYTIIVEPRDPLD